MRGGKGGKSGESSRPNSRDSSCRAKSDNSNDEEEEEHDNHQVSRENGHSQRERLILESSYPPPLAEEEEDFANEEDDDEDDALEIVVETLFGDSFRVRVSQWDTAAGLKTLLYRTQGIQMSHQHLLLGQTELLDDMSLIEQNVVDGSTLRLVLAMKGGPINSRRIPTQDDIFRDITEYVDNELEGEQTESSGGRTVTLLVLRDGDNINVYRVVENTDGSFSPLNESFASVKSTDRVERETGQSSEDGAKTRARMKELQAQMNAVRIKKKARKDRHKLNSSHRSHSRASKTTQDRFEDKVSLSGEGQDSSSVKAAVQMTQLTNNNHLNHSNDSSRRGSILVPRGGRSSRPTTQERSEMHRNSLSKSSSILKGLPMINPPVQVDFSRRRPLDNIASRPERSRLSAVDEELGKGRRGSKAQEAISKGANDNKNFESYRKSLVKHAKVSKTDSKDDDDDDSPEAWPKREVSVPLYMPPVNSISRRPYDGERLNRSHNQDLLRVARVHNTGNRPKTSPEVLEHRPATNGGKSTIGERLQLRAADDQLREICTILSNSRGNSRQSNRSSDSPPNTSYPPSLSTSFSASSSFPRSMKNNSVSVSLSSLRGHGGTPPSPVHGAMVASGSKEQRDRLRGLMRNQATSSRRNTPENMRHQGRRLGSGRLVVSPPYLPPVTPRRGKKQKPRCAECKRRIKLVDTHACRCDRIFCTRHRLPEMHDCTYDYKGNGRRLIEMANPLITPHRLPKI